MKHLWIRLALVSVLLALATLPVMAQSGEQEIPTFDRFLEALSGPLASAAVAIVLSILVEYVPQYDMLNAKWKRLVYFGLCMIVPISAAALRGALGFVSWSFDPLFWHALWYGFSAAGVGTLAHVRKLP